MRKKNMENGSFPRKTSLTRVGRGKKKAERGYLLWETRRNREPKSWATRRWMKVKMERKEKCIKAETPHTNKWLGKQKRRAGGISENRPSGTHTHTRKWKSNAQRTTTDTLVCEVRYTKRQEVGGPGPRWLHAHRAVGTSEVFWQMSPTITGLRAGGTFVRLTLILVMVTFVAHKNPPAEV